MNPNIFLLHLITLLITFPLSSPGRLHPEEDSYYEARRLKPECLERTSNAAREGRGATKHCWFIEGMKSWFKRLSLKWMSSASIGKNYSQITSHCNNYFTCMENTKCYKDYLLYETLSRCSDDAFQIAPMAPCTSTLKRVLKETPETIPECVKKHFEKPNPMENRTHCENIQNYGSCFLPVIQKHCDQTLLPIFEENQRHRLYYLGCDGKLQFKDSEPLGSTNITTRSNK